MERNVREALYAPMLPYEIETQLRRGDMPGCFVRRMRVINLLSMVALGKIEEPLLSPFDTLDLHHILDKQISQDAIIDQINNEALSYALMTGNIYALWEAADRHPKLQESFVQGWTALFFNEPFDPICMMLAMRVRSLLDLIDELWHSYNLYRFFPLETWEPITPPPGPPGPPPPTPILIVPWDVPPWVIVPPDPLILPGVSPGGVPTLGPEGPGTFDPETDPEDDDGPGRTGGPSINIFEGPGDDWPGFGGGPGGGTYYGGGLSPGPDSGSSGGGETTPYTGPGPCQDKDDPEETIVIGYTTLQMGVDEEQALSVVGYHPRWAGSNYTWEIESGGGTLSESSEYSILYTAPATNPDCDLNPAINLLCLGEIVDTIHIAINAEMVFEGIAIYTYTSRSCIQLTEDPISAQCSCLVTGYDCNGLHVYGPCTYYGGTDWGVGCPAACVLAAGFGGCGHGAVSVNFLINRSPYWVSELLKEGGCCPEQGL